MPKIIWQAGCFMGSPLVPATTMTTVTVIDTATGNPAALWDSRNGSVAKANPFTIASLGLIRFYADPGRYNVTAVNGSDSQTWPDVILIDEPAETVINTQAGTSYTAALTDDVVIMNNASANTFTVPSGAWGPGDTLEVWQGGSGQTSIVAGSGVTILRPASQTPALRQQHSGASLRWVSANTWRIVGDLELS